MRLRSGRHDSLHAGARARRTRRRALWALVVVVLVVVAGALAVDPLATMTTRRALSRLEGYRVSFGDVSVDLWKLSYTMKDLVIRDRKDPDGRGEPFIRVDRMEAALDGRRLLRGHVIGKLRLDDPKMSVRSTRREEKQIPDLAEQLREISPLRIDRAEVRNGEFLFVDTSGEKPASIWLHRVEATVENLATRPALAEGQPTVLALSGTLQKTGQVSLFASADPLAKKLTFAGQAVLRGLDLRDLHEFLVQESGVKPAGGQLDLSVRFQARDGALTGGVRPVLKNPDVEPGSGGLGDRLKAALADASLRIFSDRVPGRDAFATTIPIEGTVDDPKAEVWPTIFGVLRNSFVAGVVNSVAGLQPGGASEEPQGRRKAGRKG